MLFGPHNLFISYKYFIDNKLFGHNLLVRVIISRVNIYPWTFSKSFFSFFFRIFDIHKENSREMFDFRDNKLYCEDIAVENVFSMFSIYCLKI